MNTQYRLRTGRGELAAAEDRGYPDLVLSVTPSAESDLREHLVALGKRYRAVLHDYHVVALSDIGHEVELAVGFLYPAREGGAAEAEYIRNLALGLAGARGYIRDEHPVARHRAEHTLAGDEVFDAAVGHREAERPAEAGHLADVEVQVLAERRLDALSDGDDSLVAELRERRHEIVPVVLFCAALGLEL